MAPRLFLAVDAVRTAVPQFQIYVLYVVFGVIGGTNLATFSVGITTVAFWSPKRKQGTMNGIYGGCTNLAPGFMGMGVAVSGI